MRRLLISGAVAVLAVSCTPETVETTTATTTATVTSTIPATSTTTLPATTTTEVLGPASVAYFFFQGYPVAPGPYLATVARAGGEDLTTALTALLEGVTEDEAGMGLSSAIPEGTRLLGVEVSDGVAFVDLSREFESGGGSLSMMGRVAQVVYTATRFEEVEAVRFLLEGEVLDVLGGEGLIIEEPQLREDWVDLTPPILLEAPPWGSTVGNEIEVSGIAELESGVVSYVIVDAEGLIIHEGEITTVSGERTEFTDHVVLDEIPYPGLGAIIVWEWAPDGSQQHVLEYPLRLRG
jgi:spore germination protein GerM